MIPSQFNLRQLNELVSAYEEGHIANLVVICNTEGGGQYFQLCDTRSQEEQDHILRNFGYIPKIDLLEGAERE